MKVLVKTTGLQPAGNSTRLVLLSHPEAQCTRKEKRKQSVLQRVLNVTCSCPISTFLSNLS